MTNEGPGPGPDGVGPPPERPGLLERVRRLLVGRPRDLGDSALFHRLSLVAFLAWVGLGADGLSSSSYGPEEAFRTLGPHTYLAVALAAMTALTVGVIAAAYSHIVEEFPSGGGGYLVATKLLGPRTGVVSGSALLVDYVLTVAVSIAAAGDALFSFLPVSWHGAKLLVEVVLILLLTTLNIRGVRESVIALLPIFIVFLLTHTALIVGGIATHMWRLPAVAAGVTEGFKGGLATLGLGGMLLLFAHAYSLGGGTYTGLEAVSNGMPIMREPRVATGKRTMLYMAVSLSFMAAGLLVCYLLFGVAPVASKTMNAVLAGEFAGRTGAGAVFVVVTLFSEGALLVVAAQAGFIDGPRVLANMAVDSWVPHRFADLSERLTTQNGIVLMGLTSLAALLYTRGDVRHLVVMYSINVFLTFSLSMFGMLRMWTGERGRRYRVRRMLLFGGGFLLCATILVVTTMEKFGEGGWVTLLATGGLITLCFTVRRHYRGVGERLAALDEVLGGVPLPEAGSAAPLDPARPTVAILVRGFNGLGIHTVLNVFRSFPGYFHNFVFLSVGVVDSGAFKGADELEALRARTDEQLARYVELLDRFGFPATVRSRIGTDPVAEAEQLCLEVAQEFTHTVFVAGKVIFRRERIIDRLFHNQTAFALQKRLQWRGLPMVIMPVRVR